VRIDQTCFGRRGGFAPTSLPLFQGSRREAWGVVSVGSCMVVLLCCRGASGCGHQFLRPSDEWQLVDQSGRGMPRRRSARRKLTQSGLTRILEPDTKIVSSHLGARTQIPMAGWRRPGINWLCAISDSTRRRERFGLFRDGNGGGAKVSCGNCVEERPHFFCALGAERPLELPLRL
jgi:hypothetical protein